MASDLFENTYNPDVLTCLANLSNDEVFTPPSVVNDMLDLLPQDLFRNPDVKFLDPFCKSGVFLREIAKRLIKGLEDQIPVLQERLNHIYKEQLYGIAITELTSLLSRRSLYCSKAPNRKYSVVKFDDIQGNIRYKTIEHRFVNGKCVYCGASEATFGAKKRPSGLESHAYEFIHTIKPEEIWNMKFDVIVGNPPYQLDDGGYGKSAAPIYQLFVDQAKKLKPRYLTMIIPAKWYSGGKNLQEFRATMLNDRHVRKLYDFENFRDVFPGVDLAGGACYFLWDRDHAGPCTIVNCTPDSQNKAERELNEFETFIRSNEAIAIVKKVVSGHKGAFLSDRVSASKPFGIRTFYEPKTSGIPCYFTQKVGLQFASPSDITDTNGYLNKWKFLIPAAPIAGQTDFSKPVGFYYDGNTRIAAPGECCTESWLVAGAFDTEQETQNFKSYIMTKTVRFLLLQTVVSQHVVRGNFKFIPDLAPYNEAFTDQTLKELWGISDEEMAYIESRITNIGGNK
ncbi:MAG: Eco57I restriction-modification methylase domain-containing protein [Bacilli bacterium]|nr:Eco57I restriction-modification methylase domain-containing protein [Bacilli bacterium]